MSHFNLPVGRLIFGARITNIPVLFHAQEMELLRARGVASCLIRIVVCEGLVSQTRGKTPNQRTPLGGKENRLRNSNQMNPRCKSNLQ